MWSDPEEEPGEEASSLLLRSSLLPLLSCRGMKASSWSSWKLICSETTTLTSTADSQKLDELLPWQYDGQRTIQQLV